MASSSETGHSKNVANFDVLLSFCTGYGGRYNPTKASIQLASMTTLHTDAEAAVKAVTVSYTDYKNTTNARQVVFEP
jgi:hypothetical protein